MVGALYTKTWSAVELLYCCRDSCVVRNLARCAVSNATAGERSFRWLPVAVGGFHKPSAHLQPIVMVLFHTGQCSNTGCCLSGDSYRSGSRRTVQQVNKVSGRRLVHCDDTGPDERELWGDQQAPGEGAHGDD
jgi:hypothetical protein